MEIKYYKNIKEEINHFSKILNNIKIQIISLENEINVKNRIIHIKKEWIRFLKSKEDKLINEVYKKEERKRNYKGDAMTFII